MRSGPDLVLDQSVIRPERYKPVLVADDDPLVRTLLHHWLSSWGYQVTIVDDGARAWELLAEGTAPSLLLLDWVMPGVDGIELCRRTRKKQRDRYPYILLITSKDNKEDVVRGLEAGADDYLTKPIDMHELRARLRVGMRILQLQEELIAAREGLRFQATHDSLTGIRNRASVLDLLYRESERAVRSKEPIAVMMLDLDHFKRINDLHGHLTGDAVLKNVADRIVNSVRSYDSVGRYGGEEFLVVLPGCGKEAIVESAERIRVAIADTPIWADNREVPVTVSVGAFTATCSESLQEMLRAADAALYRAKRAGRNRVEIF